MEVPKSPLSQIQIDFMGLFQPSVPEKFRYGNPGCADNVRYVNTDRGLYGIHGRAG